MDQTASSANSPDEQLAADAEPSESLRLVGSNQRYVIEITSRAQPIPTGRLHDWVVHVENTDGTLFEPRQLSLVGGMPGHGHGFASQPKLTRYLKHGNFLFEGVKFHMMGLWHLQVDVLGPSGPDSARFEILVKEPALGNAYATNSKAWTASQLATLKSLSLGSLGSPEQDLSNRFSGNEEAAALGASLFFDPGLSATGKVSCATCHDPAKQFTDGRKKSMGSKETARHAPTLLGLAHSNWFYWDGRRDSAWAQALTPIETPGEMDNTRLGAVRYVLEHPSHGGAFSDQSKAARELAASGLGRLPETAGPFVTGSGKAAWQQLDKADRELINRTFADLGKVIGAYVETLHYQPSRFDRYVGALLAKTTDSEAYFSAEEIEGLRLFVDPDKTPCLRCHNSPLFSNREFHNVGSGEALDGSQDWGRFLGLRAAMIDEFNCYGPYSDAERNQCRELNHVTDGHADNGAFKVPSLRNVAVTAPYMHDGRFDEIDQVIRAYLELPPQSEAMHEVPAFTLSEKEISQLIAFLNTLTGESGPAASVEQSADAR